jgi:iron(III) transport system substrate-binding protein
LSIARPVDRNALKAQVPDEPFTRHIRGPNEESAMIRSGEAARRSIAALGLAAVAVVLPPPSRPAFAQMAVEKLYADLAGLPADERQRRLEDGARKEGRLVMIPNMRGDLLRRHTKLFQDRYPFIRIEASDMSDQVAAERFIAEEAVGQHLTDLIGLTLPDLTLILAKQLVARNPTPAAAAILPQYVEFRDPEHRWVPWYWSEHGISYNSRMIPSEKAPKSWQDLCNPAYRGQVSFEPGETKYLAGLYLMMGEDKFRDWAKCIGENKPVIQEGHSSRLMLMLAGDHAIQGDNFFYEGMLQKRRSPDKVAFEIVWTAPILARAGMVVISRNAPHPHASALYTDWLLSKESQEFIAANYRGPLTVKHPFIPDDANLFRYGAVSSETMDKVLDIWRKHIGQ